MTKKDIGIAERALSRVHKRMKAKGSEDAWKIQGILDTLMDMELKFQEEKANGGKVIS